MWKVLFKKKKKTKKKKKKRKRNDPVKKGDVSVVVKRSNLFCDFAGISIILGTEAQKIMSSS